MPKIPSLCIRVRPWLLLLLALPPHAVEPKLAWTQFVSLQRPGAWQINGSRSIAWNRHLKAHPPVGVARPLGFHQAIWRPVTPVNVRQISHYRRPDLERLVAYRA